MKSEQYLEVGVEASTYWLAVHGLLGFLLIKPKTTCPNVAPLTEDWVLSH